MADGNDDTEADDTEAPAKSEREGFQARIARLERSRSSVDQLVRFQIEAYKARIAELKQDLAREKSGRQAAERDLAALRARHDALQRQVRTIGRRLGVDSAGHKGGMA